MQPSSGKNERHGELAHRPHELLIVVLAHRPHELLIVLLAHRPHELLIIIYAPQATWMR